MLTSFSRPFQTSSTYARVSLRNNESEEEEEREHISVYKQHRSLGPLGPRVGDIFRSSHRRKRSSKDPVSFGVYLWPWIRYAHTLKNKNVAFLS